MNTPAKYARVDPALAIASLFRPVTRGRRPRALELVTEHDGLILTWRSFEYLDSRDQSVLYACAALASIEKGGALHADAPGETGQQLWLDLDPEERAVQDSAVAFDTTYYRILAAAGFDDSAGSYKRLKDILSRLSDVSIRAQREGYDWKMKLVSYAARPDGRISIAMNSRMAAALDGQHVNENLVERRQLHGDVAQIAHGRLCGWLRHGKAMTIGIDKLGAYIWGVDTSNPNTRRSRRNRTLKALDEVSELEGWQVSVESGGAGSKATIRRAKLIESSQDPV